jgi:hypothetical protein
LLTKHVLYEDKHSQTPGNVTRLTGARGAEDVEGGKAQLVPAYFGHSKLSIHLSSIIMDVTLKAGISAEPRIYQGKNVAILLDIAPCSQYVNRRFGGTYHLHLQVQRLGGKNPACSR